MQKGMVIYMLFNSYIFILLFLPLVLFGYYGLGRLNPAKPPLVFLVTMSFWFCGYQDPFFLMVLIGSILLNYGVCRLMHRQRSWLNKKCYLIAGVLINIGSLFCFKYYNFFVENINVIFKINIPYLNIIMPLGISFYTFQQIAYLVDNYREDRQSSSFLEYAAYITFFPKLIQGPIMYFKEFVPQLQGKMAKRPDFENLGKGIYSFALGLGKKVLLADTLAKIVNIGYSNIEALNSLDAMVVMVCYSLQIYFDFSGYCDMAEGVGYALNIRLPINFNSPYKALSVSDFWDRWHITLTRFFTKYVYIPLGGSRKGEARTLLNILVVFLVSGLWHGANWTFVVWGLLNGAIKILERLGRVEEWKLPRVVKQAAAFTLTTLAWSIFRSDSLSQTKELWTRLFTAGFGQLSQLLTTCFNEVLEVTIIRKLGVEQILKICPGLLLMIFIIILLFACFTWRNTQEKVEHMEYTAKRAAFTVLLLSWSIVSLSEISEFIYFIF